MYLIEKSLQPKVNEIKEKYGPNFLDLPDDMVIECAAVLDLYRKYYEAKRGANEDPGYCRTDYISLPENAENIIKDLCKILQERHNRFVT